MSTAAQAQPRSAKRPNITARRTERLQKVVICAGVSQARAGEGRAENEQCEKEAPGRVRTVLPRVAGAVHLALHAGVERDDYALVF